MAGAKSPFQSKVYRAAYNAARRGRTISAAKSRSRVYSRNTTKWIAGFNAGRKSGK